MCVRPASLPESRPPPTGASHRLGPGTCGSPRAPVSPSSLRLPPSVSPACTHPGAEGACTSHRSAPHCGSRTDRHVQGSTMWMVDPSGGEGLLASPHCRPWASHTFMEPLPTCAGPVSRELAHISTRASVLNSFFLTGAHWLPAQQTCNTGS